jgi:uncharacterized membrane protein (UPF0136 family)
MTYGPASWMILYGSFLIVMGLIGYLSNPEKAATAVLSGGTFGALSIAWGVLLRRGVRLARWGALATTALLAVVFSWRATVGWLAVLEGSSEKLVAAVLISVMDVASVVLLIALLRAAR